VLAGSSHLKPGEKGRIVVHISTLGRQGDAVETVEVVSNDPKRPKVTLTVRARLIN
jgi:hypothetical protein